MKSTFVVAAFFICFYASCATITSTASGNWNSTSTWDCTCIPGAADDVTIEHDVTVTNDFSVNSLTLGQEFSPNADIGTLTISSNSTLTVATGTTDLDRSGNALTIDAGSSLIKTTGDLTISATGTITANGTLNVQSGGFTVSGGSGANFSVGSSGDVDVSGDFNWGHSNQTVTIQGDMTVGSQTANGGSGTTFVVESGATYTITGALTVTTTQNYTVRGTMNVGSISATGGSPDFDVESGGSLNVSGDVTIASSAELNISAGGGSVSVGGDLAISGGGGATVDGNLAVTGELNVANNGNKIGGSGSVSAGTATCPGDDCGTIGSADDVTSATLPVDLISFSGKVDNGVVILQWSTAIEINNDYFSIERSLDGVHFELIETVSGHGTKETTTNYTLQLGGFSTDLFIRLKQTDFDGQFEYLGTIYLTKESVSEFFKVYPSVISRGETINFSSQAGKWSLFDLRGNLVQQGANTDFIQSPQRAGLYIIRLENAVFTETHRFRVR